jgi:hypothetical protein
MVILFLFLIFIYYLAPYDTPLSFQPTSFLITFSIFYFIYFFLSCLQIKYGYKKYKHLNSFMTRRGYSNSLIVAVYTGVPFLYEIKIIMDWTFSVTSISLFDWFKLFSIYLSAFKAKIQYFNATSVDLGTPLKWFVKIIGWVGFILIFLIIFGPMILFSGLNPIAESNLVIGGSLQLGIQIIGGNTFNLYQTSHFSSPPVIFN